MTPFRSLGLALAAVAALAGATPAAAEGGAMSARRFAPLPEPLVVRLETGDNDRASLAVRDALAAALRDRGVRLAAGNDATLVLRLDSEVRTNVAAVGGGSGGPGGGLAGMPDYDNPTARFGAGDPAGGSSNLLTLGPGLRQGNDAIIRRDPRAPQSYERSLRYVVNASANEIGSGRFVWQGHVRWDGAEDDPSYILARIAPRLAPLLGTSLAATRFDLD